MAAVLGGLPSLFRQPRLTKKLKEEATDIATLEDFLKTFGGKEADLLQVCRWQMRGAVCGKAGVSFQSTVCASAQVFHDVLSKNGSLTEDELHMSSAHLLYDASVSVADFRE